MFIELLVVGAILMVLYSRGLLNFDSGYAVAISIGVALVATVLGFLATHFVARTIVDRMFGFSSWTPQVKPQRTGAMDSQRASRLKELSEPQLLMELRKHPKDAELSRHVSEIFLQRGLTERFVQERQRAITSGLLTREQVCGVYNRLADVRIREGRNEEAIQFLQDLIVKYPGTTEARNAQQRCHSIAEAARPEVTEQNA